MKMTDTSEQLDLIDPIYDIFMAYVDNLDAVKSEVITAIRIQMLLTESADIKNINSDLVYVLDLLSSTV